MTILAVGRVRAGPEVELVADYLARFERTGRPLGLGPARVVEIDDRKGGGPSAQAMLLAAAAPAAGVLVALDERGQALDSPGLAAMLGQAMQSGRRDVAFAIGGADGLDPAFVAGADLTLSLGRMVWPHLLARAMLAEQLYRAASILAGTPYHRGDRPGSAAGRQR